MEPMWDAIFQQLQKISPLPDEELLAFKELSVHSSITKNNHFIRAGEFSDSIGFCVSGLFRFYYTTPDGDEFNKSFCSSNDFIASYSSLLMNIPSYFSIQALMNSEIITIRYKDLQSLYIRHACWERLGRKLIEQLYIKKETRERELLLLSAEARYFLFLEEYGQMKKIIPQYHIASYLGITPVALSRIRRKLT